jgi:hypothetical protein
MWPREATTMPELRDVTLANPTRTRMRSVATGATELPPLFGPVFEEFDYEKVD